MAVTPSATATHLPAGTGRAFALSGSSLTFKQEPTPDGTGPLLFEHVLPAGLGVPPHRERNHEAFYVLAGTLEVEVEEEGARRSHRLGPGDFLALPPGVVHALSNAGPETVRVLTLVSPGAGHARFFSTAGTPTGDPSNPPPPNPAQDGERVAAIARECGIEFLPPPAAS